MRTFGRVHAVSALWLGLLTPAAGLGQVTFTRIADSRTPVPGGSGETFTGFTGDAAIRDGQVVFFGVSTQTGRRGIYRWADFELQVVADTSTPAPGAAAAFSDFGGVPSISHGAVAFRGSIPPAEPNGEPRFGIFVRRGQATIETVADQSTPVPGAAGLFTFLSFYPFIDGDDVAFYGGGAGRNGVYLSTPAGLSKIADNTDVPPGAPGPLDLFGFELGLRSGIVLFNGGAGIWRGVLRGGAGGLQTLYDVSDPYPPAGPNFITFYSQSGDPAGDFAFLALADNDRYGVMAQRDGQLVKVADRLTPAPGSGQNFYAFDGGPASDRGRVAFAHRFTTQSFYNTEIYTDIGGALFRLIAAGDVLDGRSVTGVSLRHRAMWRNRIVFQAFFSDGSRGLYVAAVPLPPCPGDVDDDRDVGQDDLDLVLFNYGAVVTPGTGGDADGDGRVDQDDVDIVLFHFGERCVR